MLPDDEVHTTYNGWKDRAWRLGLFSAFLQAPILYSFCTECNDTIREGVRTLGADAFWHKGLLLSEWRWGGLKMRSGHKVLWIGLAILLSAALGIGG